MAIDVENVIDSSLEDKYRADGIGVYVYPDNPKKCIAWKRLDPPPVSEIDVAIIELLLEESKKSRSPVSIDYDCWDQSKPGEPPYSDSVHLLVAKVQYSDEELNKFYNEVKILEKKYKEKREEVRKKLVRVTPSIKGMLRPYIH